jgi:hypothetical protein
LNIKQFSQPLAVESDDQFPIHKRCRGGIDFQPGQFVQRGLIRRNIAVDECNPFLRKPRFLGFTEASIGLSVNRDLFHHLIPMHWRKKTRTGLPASNSKADGSAAQTPAP